MELFTIQVGKRFECAKRQIRVIDTTVKTSNRLFAPTWDMVMTHKAAVKAHADGEITDEQLAEADEQYKSQYWPMMIDSWINRRAEWLEVLHETEPVAFSCFCPAGKFCHRLILKDFVEKLCKQLNIPFTYYGELT